MNKKQIKEFIVKGEVHSELQVPMLPIDDYKDALKELGYEQVNIDTNGWQIDFWITFKNKVNEYKNLTLGGSRYYGDYKLTINKDE